MISQRLTVVALAFAACACSNDARRPGVSVDVGTPEYVPEETNGTPMGHVQSPSGRADSSSSQPLDADLVADLVDADIADDASARDAGDGSSAVECHQLDGAIICFLCNEHLVDASSVPAVGELAIDCRELACCECPAGYTYGSRGMWGRPPWYDADLELKRCQ